MVKKLLTALLFLILSVNLVSASQILYGVRGSYGLGEPADLVMIDPVTGALDLIIGDTGLTGVGGFAINPLDGSMYASGGGDGSAGLYTIDPITGLATYIGGSVTVKDMGFDSNGNLYGIMADDGSGTMGELATIDLLTGDITSIGGYFGGGIGLSFDSNGALYVKESGILHSVNKSTAAIVETTVLDEFLYNSLTIDSNNNFYSHIRENGVAQIVTFDEVTGAVTSLPNTVPAIPNSYAYISALDFVPQAIPEPVTMVLFGLGLLGITAVGRKK